jgi:hypothetical protein
MKTINELHHICADAHLEVSKACNWAEYLDNGKPVHPTYFSNLRDNIERLELLVRMLNIGLVSHAIREPHLDA